MAIKVKAFPKSVPARGGSKAKVFQSFSNLANDENHKIELHILGCLTINAKGNGIITNSIQGLNKFGYGK